MPRLYVKIKVTDDAGSVRMHALLDEVSRLDVERDPLYVFGRIEALTLRAVAELHKQALQLDEDSPRG